MRASAYAASALNPFTIWNRLLSDITTHNCLWPAIRMKRMHSDHQHWFVNSFFLLFLPIFFFSYSQNVFWGWRMRWTSKLSTDSIPQFFFSLFVSKRINQFDDRIQQNRHAKNWRHSITVSLLTLNSFFSCFGQTSDLRPHQPTNRWWVSRADRPRKSYKPNNRSIQFYSTENLPNRICEHRSDDWPDCVGLGKPNKQSHTNTRRQ